MELLNWVGMDTFSLSQGYSVIGKTMDLGRSLDGTGSAKGSVLG